ncbi:MAG: CvpA family protein, partial [Myxococcales bacterium]|nr:CvpA family protein [Myxococcales bacterium]
MWVDLAVVLIILLTLSIGWWRGFLGQFLGIAGLVIAWLATPTLSPIVAGVLSGRGYTAGSVAVASALLSFSVVLLIFRIAQGMLPEALEKWSHGTKRIDSGLGAILGGVRGLLLCWIILSAGVLVESTLLGRYPELHQSWRTSQAVYATRHYNPIAELSLSKLSALQRALARRSPPTGGPSAGRAAAGNGTTGRASPGTGSGAS